MPPCNVCSFLSSFPFLLSFHRPPPLLFFTRPLSCTSSQHSSVHSFIPMTVDDNVSLQKPSAAASLSSDMHPQSTSEHVLAILLGAALALIIVGLCLCLARRLLRLRDQQQQQQQRVSRSSSLSLSSSSPPLSPMTELPHHTLQQQQHQQQQQQQQRQLSSTSSFSTPATSSAESIRPAHSSSPHPPSSIVSIPAPISTTASASIPMERTLSNLSTLLPSAASPSSSSSLPWITTISSSHHPNNTNSTSPSESPSTSGFSLVRFFSRRASQKAPAKRQSSLRAIYLHPQRPKPVQDRTLQKRPISTTSSSDGCYWSEGGPSAMKERSIDGFPVITLTSPTDSESSIPRHDDYSLSFSGQQDNMDSSFSITTATALTVAAAPTAADASTSSGSRRHTWRIDAMESLDSSPSSRNSKGLEKSLLPKSPEYQPRNPLIPQHMFLHPLATYNRPVTPSPRTIASSASPLSTSRSDFPPTYEEALDAGASSSCGRPPCEQ